jgi:hypothetical protein
VCDVTNPKVKEPISSGGRRLYRPVGKPSRQGRLLPHQTGLTVIVAVVVLFGLIGFAPRSIGAESKPEPAAAVAGGLISLETRLNDPANDPAWRELIAQLAPNKTRQSSFEELRYFPFRKAPTVLRGEIRIVPDLGLSLRYIEPEPRLLIIDEKGMLMRDEQGRDRAPPSDSRAQAATSALVHVLRFDLEALKKDFDVHGRRDGEKWSLGFAPRDANFANLLGVLAVSGEGGAVRKIEMIKTPTQRIEINVRDTQEDVRFTADTLRRFFR